jgi:Spy/CpxP family protein refolding chaperone
VIRRNVVVLALASLVLAAAPVAAQPKVGPPMGAGVGGPGPGRPPFMDDLYRPEMVMRNQGALGITPEQRTAMAAAIRAAQDRLGTLQWDLDAKSEALAKQVEGDKVDADAALATASQVIDLEGQVKKEHLKLLITIKNLLTPAQIVKLRELRKDRRGDGPGDGRGMRFHRRMGGKPPPDGAPPRGAALPDDPPPPDVEAPDEPEP